MTRDICKPSFCRPCGALIIFMARKPWAGAHGYMLPPLRGCWASNPEPWAGALGYMLSPLWGFDVRAAFIPVGLRAVCTLPPLRGHVLVFRF